MTGATERVGVLVLRTWLDSGDPVLRARLTGRLDLNATAETSAVVAGREPAVDAVRRWLEEFEVGGPDGVASEAEA